MSLGARLGRVCRECVSPFAAQPSGLFLCAFGQRYRTEGIRSCDRRPPDTPHNKARPDRRYIGPESFGPRVFLPKRRAARWRRRETYRPQRVAHYVDLAADNAPVSPLMWFCQCRLPPGAKSLSAWQAANEWTADRTAECGQFLRVPLSPRHLFPSMTTLPVLAAF